MQINEAFLTDFLWHITFVLLFVFTIISGLIALFTKEKTYLFYALYTCFLLTYIFLKTPYKEIQDYFIDLFHPAYNFYSQTLFYSFYIYFFLYFLDIEDYFPSLTKKIKILLFWVISVSTVVFFIAVIADINWLFTAYFFYLYIPFNVVMGVLAIAKASKTPGYLKYFFVIGSVIYLCLAILSLILSYSDYNYQTTIVLFGSSFYLYPILFFYIGVFIEQIMFSLGLSYRVKMINERLLEQYQRNVLINKKLNDHLVKRESEIHILTAKAEEDRLAKLKSAYDSQINKLQLSLLHNQMNPHFIFNALNSIKVYLIENDKEKAIYYLNKFSKLIRRILESSRGDTVSLEEELNIINLYIDIEKIRFDDAIDVSFDIPFELGLSSIKVPPLLLQPFVENAIWHGLSSLENNKKLHFKVRKLENGIQLKIIDNGIGRKASKQNYKQKKIKKSSLGLQISNERIDFFNKREKLDYKFSILDLQDTNGNACGTEVRFNFTKN
ncbi:histidine kinase [Psychroflexus planctonicus]|uniref:7TM diverse intracellular signalling n=1 Tax=Psychroflexus planctonicus TaxID=1526575 RepID=A0ABQ1SGW0_9FLAO|nr:histidine kinase [Psychroflexus planctonicus]GGE34533.1 hypothetical protein GCM10010832_13420 [Psychroflexus planctonicus]